MSHGYLKSTRTRWTFGWGGLDWEFEHAVASRLHLRYGIWIFRSFFIFVHGLLSSDERRVPGNWPWERRDDQMIQPSTQLEQFQPRMNNSCSWLNACDGGGGKGGSYPIPPPTPPAGQRTRLPVPTVTRASVALGDRLRYTACV